MTHALSDVEWDACLLEPRRDRELEAYVRRELGSLPSSVVYFTPVPWIVRSMTELSEFGAPAAHLDPLLADLVGLVVSQDNSCRYCYGVQRMLMRVHGVPDSRIRQIEQNLVEAEIDPHPRAGLDFARRLSRAAPLVSGADVRALQAAGWTGDAIRELAFLTLFNLYMNRLMTLAAIPYAQPERLASLRAIRVAAPLIRFVLRRKHRLAVSKVTLLGPDRAPGRWDYLIGALAGLSCARPLRGVLDGALESRVLPTRAKALIFGVVARGLDCPKATHAANELLLESGLTPRQIEDTLTHLGSADLSPLENAVIPFARGTIRGRPAQLQQRTRSLVGSLTPEQLVEAVGVAALANVVGRLGVVTEVG
ncbi:MAG: carboxymuconolactone decarboxylase family protein [Myxococcota bacterium]